MLDRLALPLIVLTAALIILLAMAWPQGYGARSPAPFGHTPIQQTPEMKAALKKEHDLAMKRATEAAAPKAVPAAPAAQAPEAALSTPLAGPVQ